MDFQAAKFDFQFCLTSSFALSLFSHLPFAGPKNAGILKNAPSFGTPTNLGALFLRGWAGLRPAARFARKNHEQDQARRFGKRSLDALAFGTPNNSRCTVLRGWAGLTAGMRAARASTTYKIKHAMDFFQLFDW